ncbi:MAG: response regulator transcription factor [Chloroflexi bacterium]|nr:response regulator transcription factor [Chloroflexota bacterium]
MSSITVFVADDHGVMRDGLRLLLETQDDIKVVGTASNGRKAVASITELRPDIAILDITMPELNGIEAAWQVRQTCPSTQVIILSVHSTDALISRAFQAGVRGYILKDSAGAEVINAVRTVATGHRYLSVAISDKVIESFQNTLQTEESKDGLSKLSPREREILQLVVEGKTSREIGKILSISSKTVDTYRSHLMEKLNLSDVPSLVKFALQHGLTSLE